MARLDPGRRRDRIIALLSEHEALTAADLSRRLAVSVQTIRTDLRDLDDAALVRRRNGSVRLRQHGENIAYLPREGIARAEKNRIALAVKNLIPDGARIALGTGTTVERCARMLMTRRDLFVATNSMHAVHALRDAPGVTVEMAGGPVRLRDLDLIGTAATGFFTGYRMDFAIFSCGGLSPQGAVLDYNADEMLARKAIAACAQTTVLVFDSQKTDLDLACRHKELWDYDVVVTGAALPGDLRDKALRRGCRVLRV